MEQDEAMGPEDVAEARRVLEALILRCEAGELDATEEELGRLHEELDQLN